MHFTGLTASGRYDRTVFGLIELENSRGQGSRTSGLERHVI